MVEDGKEDGKMCSGGVAQGTNPRWVDAEFCGVRTQPAHRKLRIDELRRPAIVLAGICQPIADRCRDDTLLRRALAQRVIRALVAQRPISAVDHDDRGIPGGLLGGRQAEIELLRWVGAVGNAKPHVRLAGSLGPSCGCPENDEQNSNNGNIEHSVRPS